MKFLFSLVFLFLFLSTRVASRPRSPVEILVEVNVDETPATENESETPEFEIDAAGGSSSSSKSSKLPPGVFNRFIRKAVESEHAAFVQRIAEFGLDCWNDQLPASQCLGTIDELKEIADVAQLKSGKVSAQAIVARASKVLDDSYARQSSLAEADEEIQEYEVNGAGSADLTMEAQKAKLKLLLFQIAVILVVVVGGFILLDFIPFLLTLSLFGFISAVVNALKKH